MSADEDRPGLAWDWSAAGFGAACALPAAVVVLGDLPRGVALAVGVLPAAIVGVAPTRRARRAVVVLTGVPLFVGGVLAGAPVLAVAAAAGTHPSRWYVTSAFTTFLVFLLLLYSNAESAGSRFAERLGDTLLGVGLAYLLWLALPSIARRRLTPRG
jgi:hypothetical protein